MDGVKVKFRIAHAENLTSECWFVQFWGLEACERCEYKGTEECGGKRIRETGKNAKGIAVPIP